MYWRMCYNVKGAKCRKDRKIMAVIYENKVKELGKDCYSVDVNPINGEIKAGQTLKIDENEYKITCVGEEAPVTLAGLGHCTIRFNGMTEAELPGTLYVEEKAVPEIKVGTTIQIIE